MSNEPTDHKVTDPNTRLTRDDELWNRLAGARLTLDCSCGFRTSHISYLRDHYYQGNCKPLPSEIAKYRQIMHRITEELKIVYQTKVLLEADFSYLSAIAGLEDKPIVQVQKDRKCVICGATTRERFGSKAQCLKHVAKGDVKGVAILEDLIYGTDE